MPQKQTGFTLIEIAIVLVIIGLLLGGILKGQELITGARVRNIISQQDGIKAAFYGFQDRYRAYPGDYTQATVNITGATQNGNGNGRIEAAAVAAPGGVAQVAREDILVWEHLSRAGFINGTYTWAAAPTAATNPVNPYNIFLELVFDGVHGNAAIPGSGLPRHNLKTGGQIPVEIIAEVDRKIDDGLPYGGTFQFSTYLGNNAAAPTQGAPANPSCTSAIAVPPAPVWNATNGSTNCGGASLF